METTVESMEGYKLVNKDVYIGSNVKSFINIAQHLISKMDYSLYKIPLVEKPPSDLQEGEYHFVEQMMHPMILAPLIARFAEQVSIAAFDQRLFSFDYIKSSDAVMGYKIVDNDEQEKLMKQNDFKRVPNALTALFIKYSMHAIMEKQPERTIKLLMNLPRFSRAEPDPETGLMISRLEDRGVQLNELKDVIDRFSNTPGYLEMRKEGQIIRQRELENLREIQAMNAKRDLEIDDDISVNKSNEETSPY